MLIKSKKNQISTAIFVYYIRSPVSSVRGVRFGVQGVAGLAGLTVPDNMLTYAIGLYPGFKEGKNQAMRT